MAAKARTKTDDTQNILAALCYLLWPVALVLLLAEPKHPRLRYDAINGLGFAIGVLIIAALASAFTLIPVIGWVLWVLFWAGALVLAVLYAIRAYEGKRVVIPVITDVLRKNVKEF